ncbi:hypothetical protein EBU95_03935 [bacterium]|nr:hypothetical protein [bacterium]
MTLPDERTNAVLKTRNFLLDLLNPKKTPKVPKNIRKEAAWLLKHYPSQFDFYVFFENGKKIFDNPRDK